MRSSTRILPLAARPMVRRKLGIIVGNMVAKDYGVGCEYMLRGGYRGGRIQFLLHHLLF